MVVFHSYVSLPEGIFLSNVGKAVIDHPYFDGLESRQTLTIEGWVAIALPT